ncbi:MAG: hypothetical protein K2X34_13505 [Hyphomonadaceae bacterium]|nr:hypothetical protein [Hyphomonadaceae bacterium]
MTAHHAGTTTLAAEAARRAAKLALAGTRDGLDHAHALALTWNEISTAADAHGVALAARLDALARALATQTDHSGVADDRLAWTLFDNAVGLARAQLTLLRGLRRDGALFTETLT